MGDLSEGDPQIELSQLPRLLETRSQLWLPQFQKEGRGYHPNRPRYPRGFSTEVLAVLISISTHVYHPVSLPESNINRMVRFDVCKFVWTLNRSPIIGRVGIEVHIYR